MCIDVKNDVDFTITSSDKQGSSEFGVLNSEFGIRSSEFKN